jgi:hypothetical protein
MGIFQDFIIAKKRPKSKAFFSFFLILIILLSGIYNHPGPPALRRSPATGKRTSEGGCFSHS